MLKRVILVWVLVGLLGFGGQEFIAAQDVSVQAIAYNVDGRYLAVGYYDGRLAVYEVNGTELGPLVFEAQPDRYMQSLEWNPVYPSQLFYVGPEGPIFVYDVEAQPGKELVALKEVYGYGLLYAKWLKDGDRIITNPNGMQNSVIVLSVSSEESIVLDTYSLITSIAEFVTNPVGTKVLILHVHDCSSNEVYVRSLMDLAAPIEYEIPLDTEACVPLKAEWTSQVLVLLTTDATGGWYLQLHDPETYQNITQYVSELEIENIALRPGTTQIAVLDQNGLKLLDWLDWQVVAYIEPLDQTLGWSSDRYPLAYTSEIAWSPDGRYLAYDVSGGVYIREIAPPIEQLYVPTIIPSLTPSPEDCFDSLDSTYHQLVNVLGLISIHGADNYGYDEYKVCFDEYDHTVTITSDTHLAPLKNVFGSTLIRPVVNNIVIEGHGAVIERMDGASPFRFFAVAPGGHLTLRNMTLRGGYLEEGNGGAILNQGQLTLDNVIFENNTAANGSGGAIYNDGGIIEGTYTILQGNTAGVSGGALVNAGGTVTLHQSCVIENTAVDGLAIEQQGSATTDVSQNWWGSSNGPADQVGSNVLSEGFLTSEMGLCMRATPEPTLTPAPTNTPVPTITPLVLEEITPVLFPSPFWTAAPEATATP